MQTFAPEGRNLVLGFKRLDYQRLGKQRVEAWQILNTLRRIDNFGNPINPKGWANHPATRMWEDNISALAYYGILCCTEWINRGYNDSLLKKFHYVYIDYSEFEDPTPPIFLDHIKESHRSNLIRKYPEYYSEYWPDTSDDIPYYWPR